MSGPTPAGGMPVDPSPPSWPPVTAPAPSAPLPATLEHFEPPAPAPASSWRSQIPLLVGGVAVLLAGLTLLIKGEREVGLVLMVAGAGELGIKVAVP